ncbi:UNVERIFIED_CONTAM: Retrovirus-related Pol polyprotein from transposon RE2 [Sesamum latifolium]|uniref:Retrovirus-related Pol polyprotein from transposon RE2 n=1 Tax=Sesamum latifolium TaxID=2727402 RepID=A0AAW2XDU5_9LAMI
MMLTQFDKKIKTVRMDNELEFLSDRWHFLQKYGILHQKSCVYSSQQNGVVERNNKHLLQLARALMFQSCLPSHFWTEAVLTATYIVNRLPTSVLHWKSPYEVLFQKPADYTELKVFGCLAFATNVMPHKTIFTKRAHRCIFLGEFVAAISVLHEPQTYLQASTSPGWTAAMQKELDALESNQTWEITPLPPSKVPIGCRWVFKLKLHADDSIDRYKVRLVANGYNQIEGIDYNESFSPIAKTVTVRLFFAIAAARGWHIHQMDLNNAFLYDYLDEKIFMRPLEGYSVPDGHVCRLKRSLYGLKQVSRQWNQEFTTQIAAFSFLQSKHDYCLFTKQSDHGFLMLLLYIDDILITGSSLDMISEVKQYLDHLFTIKDLGVAKYFLGLEIARSAQGLAVTQSNTSGTLSQMMGCLMLDLLPLCFLLAFISLMMQGHYFLIQMSTDASLVVFCTCVLPGLISLMHVNNLVSLYSILVNNTWMLLCTLFVTSRAVSTRVYSFLHRAVFV